MYDNEFETKENKIWTKDNTNHNTYTHTSSVWTMGMQRTHAQLNLIIRIYGLFNTMNWSELSSMWVFSKQSLDKKDFSPRCLTGQLVHRSS